MGFDEMRDEGRDEQEFEQGLWIAMRHRPAPVGLKQRVLARARERRQARRGRLWMWQRITASLVVVVALAGFFVYRQAEQRAEEQRQGEQAREQVLMAMRIANRTLDRVSERLAESSR